MLTLDTRQEVAAALPKLIKLNPVVVKEVIHPITRQPYTFHPSALTIHPSPFTPHPVTRCSTGCWARAPRQPAAP